MILIHLLISYTVSPPLYLAIYCSKLSISTFANRGNIWCWRWKNRIWTDGEASWMNQITSTLCVDGMYFKQWMRKSKSETCTFNSSNRIWSARVCVFLYIYIDTLRIYNEWKWKPNRRVSGDRRFCHHCQTKNEDFNISMSTLIIKI